MRSLFILAILSISLVFAQADLTFEVASVKTAAPLTPPTGGRMTIPAKAGGPGTNDPTHIVWPFASLKQVILYAWDLKPYQVTAPQWLDTERFDFAVTAAEGATNDQVRIMWRNLLAERFGMKVHLESKEFTADEMVVARGGHKLKETQSTEVVSPGTPPRFENGVLKGPGMVTMISLGPNSPNPTGQMKAVAQTLEPLAAFLSNQLGHPVIDKTGLTGKYDFTLDFTPDLQGLRVNGGAFVTGGGPGGLPSDPGTDLATALQQQLGLRLERGKASLTVVVVDAANKVPTEN